MASINRAAIDRIKQALSQIVSVKFVVPQELKKPSKVSTEGCEVGSPSTNKLSSNNPNNQGASPVYSPRATETKTPFSKTCMNSLRSSFGNTNTKPEMVTTKTKWAGGTPGTLSPPVGSPVTPVNLKKFMDTALFSSLQGKRGPSDLRRVDI